LIVEPRSVYLLGVRLGPNGSTASHPRSACATPSHSEACAPRVPTRQQEDVPAAQLCSNRSGAGRRR
jgi:hypothetical protein